MQADDALLVQLTAAQLRDMIAESVAIAVGDLDLTAPPALLDTAALGQMLGVSEPTVRRLRRDGMPCVLIGESPRFERERVLEWLRERSSK